LIELKKIPQSAKPTKVTDSQLLDWIADERLFDGIGKIDIDLICLEMSHPDDSEETWKINWRKAFRVAIQKAMQTGLRVE
jgi:hypothetical protein